jgi:uncharacterized RDD family membrane protein YckC
VLGDVAVDVHAARTVPSVRRADAGAYAAEVQTTPITRALDAVGIVTPEAVVLEFPTASVGSRGVAKLLDLLAQGAALFAFILLIGLASNRLPGGVTIALVVFVVFGVVFLYPLVVETLTRGKTLGKAAMGLRVVTVEGAPIRFRHALLRALLLLVELFVFPPGGALAVICILVSSRDQRLGDVVAGTIVIRERIADSSAVAYAFVPPYGLEAFTASLDASRISPELYRLVRTYLLRVNELDRSARWSLGAQVAQDVARAVGQLPPPAVPPEAYLVCAAAAYQARSRAWG